MHILILVLGRSIDYQKAVKVYQDTAARGSLPLSVILRGRENRENLGPLTQRNPFRVRLVRPHYVTKVSLCKEIIYCSRTEADSSTAPQALPKPGVAYGKLLSSDNAGTSDECADAFTVEGGF